MIRRLQRDMPGIRIGLIAHGDYCDEKDSYVTKIKEFSEDVNDLCKFAKNVSSSF